MELHKLQIGDNSTGSQRERNTVPCGHHRIGGRREDLAQPAGGQHDGTSDDRADAVRGALAQDVQGDAASSPVLVAQQIQHQRVFNQPDPRITPDRRVQRPLHLSARGVATRVDDPIGVMPALAGQHQRAVGVAVERGTQLDEISYPSGTFLDQHVDRRGVAEADAGHDCVLGMRRGCVERIQDRGDAALGPSGRPVVDVHLRHHGDVQAGLAQVQRGRETRDA